MLIVSKNKKNKKTKKPKVFLLFCVVQFFFCSGIDDNPRTTTEGDDTTPEDDTRG